MPASTARAARRRACRLAAGVVTSALATFALGAPARAFDREVIVGAGSPAGWDGRAALTDALFDPATLVPCGTSAADVCDTTLVNVDPEASGTLALGLSGAAGTPDVDLYVYRSDPLGPKLAGVSAGPGADERVTVSAAAGSYIVQAVSFAVGTAGYHGVAELTARADAPPDVDSPRGMQAALVSSPSAGAASQPAVAQSPRDHDLLVAAYRVFAEPEVYASRIATAVSFDRGRRWTGLGAVSADVAANPSVVFDAAGDARLAVNSQPDSGASEVSIRTWRTPSPLDLVRHATWGPATAFSAAGDADERPMLAADRAGALLACWVRNGRTGGQAVVCAPPRGTPVSVSPGGAPAVGPYVTGVAIAADRRTAGAFTAAWVDTLSGSRDGSGLDPLWVARSADGGATWSAPVLAARARPLPHVFEGDTFRNVPLLSLAARNGRVYLAYASVEAGRGADVRLVRSDDGGLHWGEPITVNQDVGGADQFQPSIATAGRDVGVSFLDRRLDPANTFVDEWLASSDDGGVTWTETRLSHDSWDPARGAPRSPTGDLLGDHQAIVADRCSIVALAADPHLANPPERDRGFDRFLPRTELPQLFAWRVRAARNHDC